MKRFEIRKDQYGFKCKRKTSTEFKTEHTLAFYGISVDYGCYDNYDVRFWVDFQSLKPSLERPVWKIPKNVVDKIHRILNKELEPILVNKDAPKTDTTLYTVDTSHSGTRQRGIPYFDKSGVLHFALDDKESAKKALIIDRAFDRCLAKADIFLRRIVKLYDNYNTILSSEKVAAEEDESCLDKWDKAIADLVKILDNMV